MASPALRAGRRGFTVVEALSAGMILAIAAAAIGGTVSRSLQSLEDARDYQRAAQLLDQVLTKIDLIGPARIETEGPAEGQFDAPNERFSWQAAIESLTQGHLYKVTVRVSWPSRGGTCTAAAGTYLNDPPKSRDSSLEWSKL